MSTKKQMKTNASQPKIGGRKTKLTGPMYEQYGIKPLPIKRP